MTTKWNGFWVRSWNRKRTLGKRKKREGNLNKLWTLINDDVSTLVH